MIPIKRSRQLIDGIEVVQHAPEVDSRYHKVDSGPANILATKSFAGEQTSRICGLRRATFWLTMSIATLAVVIIAVAIGLAIGFTQQHSETIQVLRE